MPVNSCVGIISRTEGAGSGAEMVLNYLLEGWSDTNSLVIITAKDSSVAQTAKRRGFRVVELCFVPYKILPNLREIENKLKELKGLSAIHAWAAKSFEISRYIAWRLHLPMTCTIHDHPQAGFYTQKKHWLLKTIAGLSRKVVAVSHAVKKECIDAGYTRSITVIQNGLPPLEQKIVKSFTDEPVTVGFLGMGSNLKGFEIVADWIRSTTDKNVHWMLFGTVCEEYVPLIKQLEHEGHTHYSLAGRQEPAHIFPQIDVLVHASTSFDTYPTVLLEAARAGVAVIASMKGGSVEIVEQGKTGYLFDPATPAQGLAYLMELKGNSVLLETLSAQSLKRYEERFRIERMVNDYQMFWEQR